MRPPKCYNRASCLLPYIFSHRHWSPTFYRNQDNDCSLHFCSSSAASLK